MLRLSSSLCPFCEARAFSRSIDPTWHTRRTAATLQKRKPSRMLLSPNVKTGRRKPETPSDEPVTRSRNSPFGGMNLTEAPRHIERTGGMQQVSAAEQKRQSRYTAKGGGKKEEEKTKDPMKALKMQRALSNVSYEKRSRVKQAIMERDRFEDFDLLPIIKQSIGPQALGGLIDMSPTPIQRLAIPALLGMEDGRRSKSRASREEKKGMQQFLLAAETGSGKTLAYVLPVIDAMKRTEAAEVAFEAREAAREEKEKRRQASNRLFELEAPSSSEPDASTARPRAIILLPTSELVSQIGTLLKNLSHKIKFRTALLSSAYSGKVIRSRLFSTGGIDIVVTTPHLLSSITTSDPNILSRVTHLVIDEADSLLDRSFSPITSEIIDRATPSLKQLVLCSATIPRSLDGFLGKRFPDVQRLVTPNLHAIPRRVQLSVVDVEKVPFQGNRDLACAQTVLDIGREGGGGRGEEGEDGGGRKRVVVFVNERETSVAVARYLRSKGIGATALSRDVDERRQEDVLAEFTGTAASSSSSSSSIIAKQQQEEEERGHANTNPPKQNSLKVLVMTDLGSRGIDTLAVRHVILYDVPHTSIDFIHRLGRVGRMGRRGRGVVLVGKNDRRDVVREVREGMFKGQALI